MLNRRKKRAWDPGQRVLGVLLAVALLWPSAAHAGGSLDIDAMLTRPGTRMLAVEFFANWCTACKKAIPEWQKLHQKYRAQGLRFVVVVTQDTSGACVPPGWTPDEVICDPDGTLADRLEATNLPTALLWSWRGDLVVKTGHVPEVREAIEKTLSALPHVALDATPPPGAEPELHAAIQSSLRAEIRKTNKLTVAAGEHERKVLEQIRNRSQGMQFAAGSQCALGEELAANSLLSSGLVDFGASKRLVLNLLSAEKGCLTASSSVHWDPENPDTSVAEGVSKLIGNLRVTTQMPGGKDTSTVALPSEADLGTKGAGGWKAGGKGATALVQFESTPSGAVVMMDGKMICRNTPCKKAVRPGKHTIEMQAERYLPRSKRMKLKGGEKLAWKLEPDFGTVNVSSSKSGLPVMIDGKSAGGTPLIGLELSAGPHEIVIQDRCHYSIGKRIDLDRGEVREIELDPEMIPAGVVVRALDAEENDMEASVVIDDRTVGETPGEFTVSVCSEWLEVRQDGYDTWRKQLSLAEKETVELVAEMELEKEEEEVFVAEAIEEPEYEHTGDFARPHYYELSTNTLRLDTIGYSARDGDSLATRMRIQYWLMSPWAAELSVPMIVGGEGEKGMLPMLATVRGRLSGLKDVFQLHLIGRAELPTASEELKPTTRYLELMAYGEVNAANVFHLVGHFGYRAHVPYDADSFDAGEGFTYDPPDELRTGAAYQLGGEAFSVILGAQIWTLGARGGLKSDSGSSVSSSSDDGSSNPRPLWFQGGMIFSGESYGMVPEKVHGGIDWFAMDGWRQLGNSFRTLGTAERVLDVRSWAFGAVVSFSKEPAGDESVTGPVWLIIPFVKGGKLRRLSWSVGTRFLKALSAGEGRDDKPTFVELSALGAFHIMPSLSLRFGFGQDLKSSADVPNRRFMLGLTFVTGG